MIRTIRWMMRVLTFRGRQVALGLIALCVVALLAELARASSPADGASTLAAGAVLRGTLTFGFGYAFLAFRPPTDLGAHFVLSAITCCWVAVFASLAALLSVHSLVSAAPFRQSAFGVATLAGFAGGGLLTWWRHFAGEVRQASASTGGSQPG